ncbi:MAG: sugar O-acetyltransferase, partial [Limosilactobacillus fermentum]
MTTAATTLICFAIRIPLSAGYFPGNYFRHRPFSSIISANETEVTTMVEKLDLNTPEYAQLEERIQQNQLLVQELNTQVHDAAAVRELVSQITGRPVDESTEIRLPFYTDCGVRIPLGKQVFINSNCMFTDLGTI